MIRTLSAALLLASPIAYQTFATDYEADRSLKVTRHSEIETETETEILRDGEPVEARFGGTRGYQEQRSVVTIDTVRATEGGRPTHVRRSFAEVEISGASGSGENAREIERPCSYAGAIIELHVDDEGDTIVELIEGDDVEDDALEGHRIGLTLDLLLPEGSVDADDSWELDAEDVIEVLALELDGALFGSPPMPEGFGGRGGGGGGGRGRGRGGFGPDRGLRTAEWEGEATLSADTVTVEDVECRKIDIELGAEGELEEFSFGRGRERQDGRALPAGVAPEAWDAFWSRVEPGAPVRFVNEYEYTLTGALYFSVAEGRPVLLELEGTMESARSNESERDGSTISFTSLTQGEYSYRIVVEAIDKVAIEDDQEDEED